MNGTRKTEDRVKGGDRVAPWMQVEAEVERMTEVHVDAGIRLDKGSVGIGWAWEREGGERVTGNERVNEQSTMNEAEMIAIEKVMDMWSTEESVMIVSDSAGAVEGMKMGRTKNKRVAMIQRKNEERSGREARTGIIWRKGHSVNNLGNRKVHEETTMGLDRESVTWKVRRIGSKNEERKRIKECIKGYWQRESGTTGRLFYKFCKTVEYEPLDLSRKDVQLLTGHGNFPGYLARFNLEPEVPTPCGYGEPETADHVIERCMDGDRTGWRERKERIKREKRGDNTEGEEWKKG
nr:uncharacterized protein LOC111515742 [Leptinotarsa decemlineata]